MGDRTQPNRDDAFNRIAPSAPSNDDSAQDGRDGVERPDERSFSPSSKPALTERERLERWPVD